MTLCDTCRKGIHIPHKGPEGSCQNADCLCAVRIDQSNEEGVLADRKRRTRKAAPLTMKMKKCPFCGGAPVMTRVPIPDGTYRSEFYVACTNEECEVEVITYQRRSREEAARLWDKRYEGT